jgi:LuxR family transcriptional regulator, maltose regulon positive regulatory protein
VRTAERIGRPLAFDDAKLVRPRIREGIVPRPELVYRLRPTARSTVALIVAPGGYGKTTLLSELTARGDRRPFVWITVDGADNDPLAFARCVTRALERAGIIQPRAPRAKAPPQDSHAVLVARLVKALREADPVVIAIDDLHLLTSLRSRKIVEAVANNLPPQSQLLLAGRTHPRLGLTALRAQGRLIELGTDDLRLSPDEGLELLRAAGTEASAAGAADLIDRAEGWPAGLYLAALANAGDGVALSRFDGSDRFVVDYFEAEYLDELDAEERNLLIEASVLDRPSGPMCDAVLDTSGSAILLDRIARSNLFLTGVGSGKPRVYRLHPMLRDALAGELRQRDPGRAAAIAARAADWSERHGDAEAAIEYAWTAGDRERFAALVEHAALSLSQMGRLAAIESWLSRLDSVTLARRPALAIYGGYVHNLRGRPDEADAWAALAAQAPVEAAMPDGTASPEPWRAVLRAAMCRGGTDEMRQDAADALSGLAEGSTWRPIALMLLGVGQVLAGEPAAADEILAEAHLAATAAHCSNAAAVALASRSLLAAADERWDAARNLAATARDTLHEAHLEEYPTSPLTFVASARAAVHASDWVRARNDLARARENLPAHAPAWLAAQVHLEAARAHLGLSERGQAAEAFEKVETLLARSPDLGVLSEQTAELREQLERSAHPVGAGERLTPAELRLLPLLTTHLTFREIGELLHISRNTVKTQAICTYRKLGVTSRSEAIDRAIELHLVEKPGVLGEAERTASAG